MKQLIALMVLLGLVSCSHGNKAKDVDSVNSGVELADAEDYGETGLLDAFSEGYDSEGDFGNSIVDQEYNNQIPVSEMGALKEYVVGSHETLMIISFKLYGDYTKWKELLSWNQDVLNGSTSLSKGMTIKYYAPDVEFVWNPGGTPYLIKAGDTLGTISQDRYNTTKYWKEIWHNNEPLIKNPDKIYAGFTIFTPHIDDSREIATDLSL